MIDNDTNGRDPHDARRKAHRAGACYVELVMTNMEAMNALEEAFDIAAEEAEANPYARYGKIAELLLKARKGIDVSTG